jgi:hypothetical protein
MNTIRNTRLLRTTTTITAALAAATLVSLTTASASYAERPVADTGSAATSSGALIDIERVVIIRKHQMAAYLVAHAQELQSLR